MFKLKKKNSGLCHTTDESMKIHELLSQNEDIWSKLRVLRKIIASGEKSASAITELAGYLDSESPDIAIESLSLLSVAMLKLGAKDDCVESAFFPKIVGHLGSQTPRLRMSAINCLYAYSNTLDHLDSFIDLLIHHGLESSSDDIRNGSMIFVNMLITTCKKEATRHLLNPIVKIFSQSSPTLFHYSFCTLRNFHIILGKEFPCLLKKSHPNAYNLYESTLNILMNPSSSGRKSGNKMKKPIVTIIMRLKSFSFLSKSALKGVTDENEIVRYKAVRKIRSFFQNFNCDVKELRPHLENFFKLLDELLDDVTAKVKLLSLDILAEIIERITCEAILHLRLIMVILFKTISCHQQLVKKQGAQILQRLMHDVHPMAVIKEILLKIHQSPIIRVELIDIITVALLSFPLHCFEIGILFQEIAPFLEDFVLNVRQAAFECYVTLSYASVVRGKNLQEFASSLGKTYGVNKDTVNSIMKRVKNRCLPQCQRDGGFSDVSYPSFQQNIDSIIDETSDDSYLTMTCSELEDSIQKTSEKKKSIFTINCASPKIRNGENLKLQSMTTEAIPVNDIHRTIKETYKSKSAGSSGSRNFNRKLNEPEKIQTERKEKGCLQHLYPQKRNELQQRHGSSIDQQDCSEDIHNSTYSTESIPSVNKSKSKLRKHIDKETKRDLRHENSLNRNTSTPENGNEELSECFKRVDERLSTLTLEDTHRADIEYSEYQENTTVLYSDDSSSTTLQSPSQTPEKYSYIANCEQGEGDYCASVGAESKLKNTQVSGCGNLAEEILMDGTSSHNSQKSDDFTEEIKDDSLFEKESNESSRTVETLPPNHKNFNILVIEQKVSNALLYIEEVLGSNNSESEDKTCDDNDVHVVIDYPPTSTSSVTENENGDSVLLQKYNMVLKKGRKVEEAESEMYSRNRECCTTRETTDKSEDNDNNYDADYSQTASVLDYVREQQSDLPTYDEYKDSKSRSDATLDSIAGFNQTSNARSAKCKTKEQTKQSTLEFASHESKGIIKEKTAVKEVAQKHKPSRGYTDHYYSQKKKDKVRVPNNPLTVHGVTSTKQNNVLKLANCSATKQTFEVTNHGSHEIILSKDFTTEHKSKRQEKINCDSNREYDLNHTRVLKKNFNPQLPTNSATRNETLRSDISIENNKTYKPRKYSKFHDEKDDGHIKSQRNSTKDENPEYTYILKEKKLDKESNGKINKNDFGQIEECSQWQQKSKPSTERRASHQWIQNIDFLSRSQKCIWSDTFEQRIAEQRPLILGERDDFEDLKLILDTLREEDMMKCEEGMLKIIRVANFYPHMISEYQLNQIMITLIGLIKSLKPSVAGQAVLTIGHLFMILKRPVESKFKIVIRDLLQRSGSRTFAGAYNAVIKSIFYILQGLSPQKAVPAFISEGSNHPNKAVRETTAQFLSILIEKLGPNKSLSPPLSKLIITTAAAFAMDGSPLTRHCGKIIFSILMSHPNFDELKKKFLSDKVQLSISKILNRIKSYGIEKEILPIDVILKEYM